MPSRIDSRTSSEWIFAGAVALLLAAGGFLRAWPIVSWPIWLDEAYTWQASRSGLLEFLTWDHDFEQGPLSFLAVRLSTAAFGTEAEWALRLPSTVAGILCIPIAYLLGRTAASRLTGVVFATLVAFDPLLIDQARQARMYSLLVLIMLATLLGLAALSRRSSGPPSTRDHVLLAGVLAGAVAALWTHALGLLLLPAVVVGLAAAGRRRIAVAGSIVLAAAAIPTLWRVVAESADPQQRDLIVRIAWLTLGEVGNIYRFPALGPFLVAGAAAAGLVLLARRDRAVALAVGVIVVLGLVAGLVAGLERNYGLERYLALTRVGIHFGLAALAGLLSSPRWRAAVSVVLIALAGRLMIEAARFEMPVENRAGQVVRVLAPQVAAGEIVYYWPQVLGTLGEYYRVPGPGVLWPSRAFPEPYPYTASWLVVGHGAPGSAQPTRVLEVLGEHYGTDPDLLLYSRLYSVDRALAARVEPGEVSFLTMGGERVRSRFGRRAPVTK